MNPRTSRITRRNFLLAGATSAAALVVAACANQPATPTAVAVQTPVTVSGGSAPAPASIPTPVAGAPSAGPNLLSKSWSERLGIIVSELKQPTGPPILQPKDGDLWFFSNASTTWGATNPKNAVWVIDAKTKKTVAEVAPPTGPGRAATVSRYPVTASSFTYRCSEARTTWTCSTGAPWKLSKRSRRWAASTTGSSGTTRTVRKT